MYRTHYIVNVCVLHFYSNNGENISSTYYISMPMQYVCTAIYLKVMHSVILVMDRQILIMLDTVGQDFADNN